jgi:hypothetical protein
LRQLYIDSLNYDDAGNMLPLSFEGIAPLAW